MEKSWLNRVAILAPYAWLVAFFLLPFLVVVKISLSQTAIAQPPYLPVFDPAAGWEGLKEFFAALSPDSYGTIGSDALYLWSYLKSLMVATFSTLTFDGVTSTATSGSSGSSASTASLIASPAETAPISAESGDLPGTSWTGDHARPSPRAPSVTCGKCSLHLIARKITATTNNLLLLLSEIGRHNNSRTDTRAVLFRSFQPHADPRFRRIVPVDAGG